jgi:beta-fructofuranosidase
MNDPNGVIQWAGTYHLFYQHNPQAAVWGVISWGHATSTDLVHWTHQPLALVPTPGAYDGDGCWSGYTVDNAGVPTILYTGVHDGAQRPCLATGDADLRTWQKYPGNPVIAAPPADLDVVGFRDHTVWREGAFWYQGIGSGIRGVGGAVLLYRSLDLIHWEYLHPLCAGTRDPFARINTGMMWECPDFFPLGDRHVLLLSVEDAQRGLYAVYFTGTYAGQRFTPESVQWLDYGLSFYAPLTLRDAAGRRLLWGWLREERTAAAQQAAGWSGVMSLPRVLTLRSDGVLEQRPAPELAGLRGTHYRQVDLALRQDTVVPLPDIAGDSLEIQAEFALGSATSVGFSVRCSPDGQEQTRIVYYPIAQRLCVDTTQSSLDPDAPGSDQRGLLALAPGEPLRLHIFLDRSVLEVFANDRACLTRRLYPTRPDSRQIAIVAAGGSAQLLALDIWPLASIWPDTT